MTQFTDLGLIEPLLNALATEGYTQPTPIQMAAIPFLLEGHDLLGIAQTGTGKTAAFALPILQWLSEAEGRPEPKTASVLILTPTRELAVQIAQSFATYGRNLKTSRCLIYGGVGQNPQVNAMRRGVDIIIATPGRLLDLMNQGHVKLNGVETFVLDEADRMLDMGFINDVRKIVAKLPKDRQTIFFSATMAPEVSKLAGDILRNHKRVEVAPPATTVERIAQKVMFVNTGDKLALLRELLKGDTIQRAIIFTRTKHGANRIAEQLVKAGETSDAIHGNKSQNARQKALTDFRNGKVRTLVATDIAARGIDIDGISHIINYDLPNEPESYVHRIGRTARAGADGTAFSFCAADEVAFLHDIEKITRQKIEIDGEHPFHAEAVAASHASGKAPRVNRQNQGQRQNQNRGGGRPGGPKQARPANRGNGGGHRRPEGRSSRHAS
ncbi:MAG: DEAD/DEAH box helicase [Proteobacteria bacterium]|nr:DEAD/DEAH box helicase [Pseudomonadota bacterium]